MEYQIWFEQKVHDKKKTKVILLIIGDIQHKNLLKVLVFLTKTYLVRKTCSMETIPI